MSRPAYNGRFGESYYLALLDDPFESHHLAANAARLIEDWIRANGIGCGQNLGREQDIANRFAVGRSVAREAIRILERRGVGKPRPGPGGGFIVGRLSREKVGRAMADYFRLVGFSRRQLLDAREAVDMLAARLAAERNQDEEVWLPSQIDCPETFDGIDGELKQSMAFRLRLATLSGNSAVILFVECLNALTLDLFDPRLSRDSATFDLRSSEMLCRHEVVAAIRRSAGDDAAKVIKASVPVLGRVLQRQFNPCAVAASGLTNINVGNADSRATDVARQLLGEIAAAGGKRRIGSEWELSERYGVGRHVLRQAVRILEDCGAVQNQRGRGHGLMSRDTRAAGIVRLVTGYLVMEGSKDLNPRRLICLLNVGFPVLAASRASKIEREVVRKTILHLLHADQVERLEYLQFLRYLTSLADCPIIDLLSLCIIAYNARTRVVKSKPVPVARIADHLELCREVFDRIDDLPDVVARLTIDASARMMDFSLRSHV